MSRPPAPALRQEQKRLAGITLGEVLCRTDNPVVAAERKTAIRDLLSGNYFAPRQGGNGPFHLHLSLYESMLMWRIQDCEKTNPVTITMALSPFRHLLKDYAMMCGSYHLARKEGSFARLETIDMGRRALHDEGAALLQKRFGENLQTNFATARQLFTLIYSLYFVK